MASRRAKSGGPVSPEPPIVERYRRVRPAAVWSVLVVGVVGFALLAAAYAHDPLAALDEEVALRVADSMPAWAEALARPFSWIGGWIGITLLCVVVMLAPYRERSRLDLVFFAAAVVGCQLAVALFKQWFDRPRPDVGSAVPLPWSMSFPSGHAATGVAAFGAAAVLAAERVPDPRRRAQLWVGVFALGLAIGLSRVVLNVHYVTDVLAGWCLGLAWLAVCLLARDAAHARDPEI